MVPSLLFPDAGSRRADDDNGRPAKNRPVVVYADSTGTTLATIFANTAGAPGAQITESLLATDSRGYLPLFWGPTSGADKLWVRVGNGPVWPVDADANSRMDLIEAGGGGGGVTSTYVDNAVATHAADTTSVHGVVDMAALETTSGAQAKVDAAVDGHKADTTDVHGIADMALLETTDGSQAKADAARNDAVAASAQRIANLADLSDASVARTNLGLGDAATLDVGQTTGTVAAGDDPRFGVGGVSQEDVDDTVASHSADTTSVHGIADTSALVLTGDARLTNSRTPTAHAASHASAGSDPVTVAQSQVTGLTGTLGAKADLVGGVVPSSQIPAIALVTFLGTVVSEAAMLALVGESGDWAIRSDTGTTWVITGPDPTLLADWTQMPSAGAPVVSVNGETGAVTLSPADVGALAAASNLSDVANAGTARTNLGLGTAAVTNTGTGAGNTILGDDARLTDARTPTTHAASHGAGGGDPVTVAQSQVTGLSASLSGKQDADADLTAIAALTPTNDDLLQRKAGAWTNRTPVQVKTDLALTKSDVGLGNADNTSDINKPVSTAQQTALDAKAPTARTISTTAPLAGGGDLSANRTLTVADATTGAVGVVRLAGDLAGTASAPTIANSAITDAKVAAGAAIAQSKVANLTTDLAGKVAKGTLVINVMDHGATGNSATDDTTAINAALTAATPGTVVWFPAPTSYYRITGPLTVPTGVSVLGPGRGCEIRQMTTLKPVFDVLGADNVTIRGFTLRLGPGPAATPGSSFRQDNGYGYCAGVWTNGNHIAVSDLHIIDFSMGVYFNGYNATVPTIGDGVLRVGNTVRDCEIVGANMGVLFLGQTGLRISGIYYHDGVDSSSGVNPIHSIYGTGTSAQPSSNVVISDCVTANCPTGAAYQVKYVAGLAITNSTADNCYGLFNGIDITDATISNLVSRNDICNDTSTWSFTVSRVTTQPARVTIDGVQIHMDGDGYPMLVRGDDVRIANVTILSNHTGANTNLYDLQLRGNRITVDGLKIHNRGGVAYKGIFVGATGYPTSDVTISNLECTNVRTLVDFDAVVTGTNVVDYAPGLQRSIPTGTNFIDQANGTATFSLSRREWTNSTSITAGATATPRPPLETVSRFVVGDTTGFTVAAPVCRPKTGLQQDILFVNASGGTLGVITWNATYSFRNTFQPPGNGEATRVTFVYDGTVWRETLPSLPASSGVPSSRQVIAGTGLTGGGALTSDVTLTVGYGTTSTTAAVGNDSRITGAAQKASNLSDLASASTARTNLGLGGAAQLAVGTTAGTVAAGDDSRIVNAATRLTVTSVKTSNYTAAANEFVQVDATSGAVVITLPAANVAGQAVVVKRIEFGGNSVTVQRAGSDTIGTGAATSVAIVATEGLTLVSSGAGTWMISVQSQSLTGLDTRYTQRGNNLSDVSSTATARTNLGVPPSTRAITAGTGLTGGGDLSADRTLTVSYGTTSTTAAVGNDSRITGALQAASNLSDVASASTARTNLGLGGAAQLAVGTTAGTVAAGDDSRIVGAVQTSRQVIAGTGLTGGGTLAADRTLTVAYGTTSTTAAVGDDSRITGAAQKASNLSDLASASTARTNLGLGTSATLDVGTSTGTVAAGDDSRIVGAAKIADVQTFTSSGTWTKPAGAVTVDVLLVGPGSGGGSGRRGAAGTVRCGGGGGSSAGTSRVTIPAASLPGTVSVTVSAQSTGGAAITTDDTNGANASAVSGALFGTYLRTGVNQSVGIGGTNAAGAAGAAGSGVWSGAAGGAASVSGGVGANGSYNAGPVGGGGGAGGGITTGDVAANGGNGGNVVSTTSAVMTGGIVGGATPVTAITQPVGSGLPGHGGGGGAASTSGAAQAGADGGRYGAGGGGGGASVNGSNSGKGGDGGPAIAIICVYF